MYRNSSIIFITGLLLAIALLGWGALFFGLPFGLPFSGLAGEYELWKTSKERSAILDREKADEVFISRFLLENKNAEEKIKNYFIKGEEGQLRLLEEVRKLGDEYNASTSVSSLKIIFPEIKSKKTSSKTASTTTTTEGDASLELTIETKAGFTESYRLLKALENIEIGSRIEKASLRKVSLGAKESVSYWAGTLILIVPNFNRN